MDSKIVFPLLALLHLSTALYIPAPVIPPCKSCSCKSSCDLVLPPVIPELPCGLGYEAVAAPLVASAFNCGCGGAYVPLTTPCKCSKLATPLCPEMVPFVQPLIL